jgi:hypothetical protein
MTHGETNFEVVQAGLIYKKYLASFKEKEDCGLLKRSRLKIMLLIVVGIYLDMCGKIIYTIHHLHRSLK